MFGNISEGLHQGFGILAGETERDEEPRFSAIVRVGFVEKIVDHLATIDDSKVSVAKLHIGRIVARRAVVGLLARRQSRVETNARPLPPKH